MELKIENAVEEKIYQSNIEKFLNLRSDGLLFGINTTFVTEIITNTKPTKVPLLPYYIKGIINLRGRIIPIVDIRLRLGKEEIEYDDKTCQHAEKLSDLGLETILLGGKVKSRTRAMIGVEAIRQLGQYRFQKVFMGMNGVDVEYGFTTPDTEEAEVKRLAMAQGNQVYVLVDYDKIGKVSFCRVANIDDAIIVTNQLEPSVSAQLNQVTTVKEC